jgi:hypothetical protein
MKDGKDALKSIGFILVAISFAGLMLADFVFGWGTVGTLTFATFNAAGLVILGLATRESKAIYLSVYFRGC